MRKRNRWTAVALLALSGALIGQPGSAQTPPEDPPVVPARHALVIGNATYPHLGNLPSAGEDVNRVTEKLEALGFTVLKVDGLASADAFNDEVIPAFRKRLREGDLVVFYFSGHGFSYGPDNFLAPQDMPRTLTRNQLADRAIAVEGVLTAIARRRPGVLLMLIDACRTVAGFVTSDTAAQGLIPKGMTPAAQPAGLGTNTLVGFAARPGTIALGSSVPGQLSVFTAALVEKLAAARQEFGPLFDDVSADVRIGTADAQEPGLMDWSTSNLFLRHDPQIEAEVHQVWLSAKASGRRANVQFFLRRHAVSSYAAVARQWLQDNPADLVRVSAVSPLDVEQAWLSLDPTALGHTGGNFAFAARIAANGAPSLAVPEAVLDDAGDLAHLLASRRLVTTLDMVARSAPAADAAPLARVPAGTAVVVQDVQRRSASGTTWLDVHLPSIQQRAYLPLSAAPPAGQQRVARPLALGISLLEINVQPQASGLSDLLETKPIMEALALLASQGRSVQRVSLASAADSRSEREWLDRQARLTHATYLLRQAGIGADRITAVSDAPDFTGRGVRIRFFGQ